tara:strand:- start:57 stop:254 length:198 start_codon:yes stop_codon:yes gene_type:complete
MIHHTLLAEIKASIQAIQRRRFIGVVAFLLYRLQLRLDVVAFLLDRLQLGLDVITFLLDRLRLFL